MDYMDEQLVVFKEKIEASILTGGAKGKKSTICSSALINLIHDAVKYELAAHGVSEDNIYPPLGEKKPEIKLSGFLKQKNQDVCVVPSNIPKEPVKIDWGPMAVQGKRDPYGFTYSTNTLVINIRSQMSSLGKNSDTLFERTFAEAQNLHMRYPDMVLGEVYLIPVYEYDDAAVAEKRTAFKSHPVNVEKYVSFFDSISGRKEKGPDYMYERCALLAVDFRRDIPRLFRTGAELKKAGLISHKFESKYDAISFQGFAADLLKVYAKRYDIDNLR